jgi:integrase
MTRTSNVVALRPAEPETITFKNGKVPPKRLPNAALRPREYLTPKEVERLTEAARRRGRYGQRDATLILLAYRHALRVKELVELEWSSVDFDHQLLHVRRVKNGVPSVQPLRAVELRALRQLRKAFPEAAYVCMSERGTPMTVPMSTDNVRKMIAAAGREAGLPFPVHPHMLRHGAGYKLANAGHDTRAIQHYLGHRNIQHTVRYTEMAPARFKDFWKD